jgi:hypothetical protein
MATSYTPEQQATLAAYAEVEKRLLPAKLKNTYDNGLAITKHLNANGLPHTSDNIYKAIDALLFVKGALTWVVPPAKLTASKEHEGPRKLKSAQDSDNEFTQKLRAGEAADAKAAADKASVAQAKQIIAGYTPVKNTPRGQVIDYAKQAQVQAELTKALDAAIAEKCNLQDFAKTVAGDIQRRYKQDERASERL